MMDARFRARDRLRGRNAFGDTLQRGRRQSGEVTVLSTLRHTATDATGPARLGIAVPKKVVARAVDRARCKRLIREAFRRAPGRGVGVDAVVRVSRRPKDGKPFERALRSDLARWFGAPEASPSDTVPHLAVA
jgi:ribonuclease P protein component